MESSFVSTVKNFIKNCYEVSVFETAECAAKYLCEEIADMTVGFGDSATLLQMNLYDLLSENNTVYDPQRTNDNASFLKTAAKCLETEIYITSANAVTQNGEILNMDGTGNRVAASLFGHKKVYYVIGRNKICSDISAGIDRIKKIAAPQNAHRLALKTPCAIRGDKCYDCSSPDRICNALLIQMKKMRNILIEIILIDEDLGF